MAKELRRHCEDMYTDQEETREVQEKRVKYFKEKGDRNITEDGRGAEITMDLVLQARAKMSENKVNGPEGAVASEMIKRLLLRRSTLLRCVFKNASWTRRRLQVRGRL